MTGFMDSKTASQRVSTFIWPQKHVASCWCFLIETLCLILAALNIDAPDLCCYIQMLFQLPPEKKFIKGAFPPLFFSLPPIPDFTQSTFLSVLTWLARNISDRAYSMQFKQN